MSGETPRLSPHKPKEFDSSNEQDTYELMLEKSGCSQYHYKLQDCFYDNNSDWRKCQKEMMEFRECMSKGNKHQD